MDGGGAELQSKRLLKGALEIEALIVAVVAAATDGAAAAVWFS